MAAQCKLCNKNAVIIENKIYYCGPCYVNRFVRVRKGLQSKPLDNRNKSTDKGKLCSGTKSLFTRRQLVR